MKKWEQFAIFKTGDEICFEPDKPWLAPMAGYSDLPFRLLCRSFGAFITETEMISAKGLLYGTPATYNLLHAHPFDSPLIVQLFGNDPENISQAVRILRKRGYKNFDLNLGCPVRKVFKQHAGASLLDDKNLLAEIAKSMIGAVKEEMNGQNNMPGKCGFKLRAGVSPEKPVLPDMACMLEEFGADWITVHPRYASQGYSGKANWEIIFKTVQKLSIPLIASGDLHNAAKGIECMKQTGASSIMYARGALYNPAIFQEHQEILHNIAHETPNLASISQIIKRHGELAREFGNPKNSFIKMRSLLPRYIRNFPGVQKIREAVCHCRNWDELDMLIDNLDYFIY